MFDMFVREYFDNSLIPLSDTIEAFVFRRDNIVQAGNRTAPPAQSRAKFLRSIPRTSPRKVSGCILCKKRGRNALFSPGKICYNRMVYFVFLVKGYLA